MPDRTKPSAPGPTTIRRTGAAATRSLTPKMRCEQEIQASIAVSGPRLIRTKMCRFEGWVHISSAMSQPGRGFTEQQRDLPRPRLCGPGTVAATLEDYLDDLRTIDY